MHMPHDRRRWEERLHRSVFFFGALLLHLVVFLMVATWVVYQPTAVQPDPLPVYILHSAETPTPPPRAPDLTIVDAGALSSGEDIHVAIPNAGLSQLQLPIRGIEIGRDHASVSFASPATPTHITGLSPGRAKIILANALRIRSLEEIRNHDPTATFPIYVATYAHGDWAYNSHLDKNGNIIAGSIPDLAAKINEWSHGTIKGVVVQKPLNIGSHELLDKMPPFIFFTGHKDFVLTEDEVTNLRDYLQDGGAIWGDNALAGKGSFFDIAFRREMKRVVPDHDFEAVPMDDGIYKNKFVIDQVPAGINYHAEPIEHLDIDGVLAILYTPNDYCDLYAMRILPGDTQIQLGRLDPKTEPPLTTSYFLQSHRNVFFRNFTLESSLAVHRLGMNIVTFFITRFDDKLQVSP